MRLAASVLMIVGVLIACGGRFAVPGVLIAAAGAWLYSAARAPSSETVAAVCGILAGLGGLWMCLTYVLQRFTA